MYHLANSLGIDNNKYAKENNLNDNLANELMEITNIQAKAKIGLEFKCKKCGASRQINNIVDKIADNYVNIVKCEKVSLPILLIV